MSRVILLCAVAMWLKFHCAEAQGQESRDLKDRFLNEAPHAWEKFHGSAKRLQGSFLSKIVYGSGEVALHSKSEIKQAEGFALSLEQSLLAQDKDSTGRLKAVTPQYGFELRRREQTGGWTVFNVDLASVEHPFSDDLFQELEMWANAPITFLSISASMRAEKKGYWPTVIMSRGFSIKRVVAQTQKEKQWAKVEFQYQPNGKSKKVPSMVTGWALLDPERLWSIQEYDIQLEWAQGAKVNYAARYQYEESRDAQPVLKRLDIASYGSPDKSRKMDIVYEFDLREAEVLAEDFTLSSFGFPEPRGVVWPTPTKWWLWITLAAVGSAALAFLFVKLRERYFSAQTAKT